MHINEIEIDLQKIKKDILNFIKNSDDFENYLKSGLQKEREVYIDYAIAY